LSSSGHWKAITRSSNRRPATLKKVKDDGAADVKRRPGMGHKSSPKKPIRE
jgi:hypothetical protein